MFVDRFIDWAHNCLLDNEEAQSYLHGRGISSEQWERYKIGYVSGDFDVDPSGDLDHGELCLDREMKFHWCDSCRYRNWSSSWEEVDGEFRKKQFVGRRIHGSVVFPLTSYSGNSVGFQTRSIIQKSYDTFAIRRRPEGYFFGVSTAIESIWSTKEAWVVEGPGDALIIDRLVSPNVVALTTNKVNSLQLKFLLRFVDTVNLCLDLDKAGRDGVNSFINNHSANFRRVRNVNYKLSSSSTFKDVGDLWKYLGDDKFRLHFQKNVMTTF